MLRSFKASGSTRATVAVATVTAVAASVMVTMGGQAGAAAGASLSPTKGPVGTKIQVSGKCTDILDGYETTADINLYYPNAFETIGGKSSFHTERVTAKASGAFSGTIKVGPAVAYTKKGPGPAVPGDEVLRKPKPGDTIKVQVVCRQNWTAYPIAFVDGNTSFTVTKPLLTSEARPKIKGTPKVGKTLTATKGSWSPKPSSYGFKWLRNGSPIKKATKKTYVLTAKDKGKKIKVAVIAARSGYAKTKATSKAVTIK